MIPHARTKYAMASASLGLLLVATVQAQTSQVAVHFDPAATEIHWTLSGTTHTTHGTFKLKGGLVTFDPSTGVAQGELLVSLASGESGNADRDAKMQQQVLESDKYPEAFFHPTKVTGALKSGQMQSISVDGIFNVHGADHPLRLETQIKLDGDQATATTHFRVPYVAWGMKDPSVFVLRVGKEVDIDIVAHGTVEGRSGK